MESREDVSVVRLHNILLKRRDDVLRGRNNDVVSVRLHDVSDKSQMKHHQDVSVVRVLDVPLVRLYDVSCKSQIKQSVHRCGTSPSRLRVTLLRRLIIRSLLRFQVTLSLPPSGRFPLLI